MEDWTNLYVNVLKEDKASYQNRIIIELSKRLSLIYGKGFEKSAVFRMIKFYQEIKDYEKVAILSQQ